MYGIPNMKLEKWVIDRKQKVMEEEGVKFVVNADVGKTVKAADIVKDYDSVILACGASNPRDIKATGREADGIYFAVDFLTRSTKHVLTGKKDGWVDTKGKNVVVIGGGDTGNDCVGTAVRQGAKSVVQIEMMPKLPDERAQTIRGRNGLVSARQITVRKKRLPYLDMTLESIQQPLRSLKRIRRAILKRL